MYRRYIDRQRFLIISQYFTLGNAPHMMQQADREARGLLPRIVIPIPTGNMKALGMEVNTSRYSPGSGSTRNTSGNKTQGSDGAAIPENETVGIRIEKKGGPGGRRLRTDRKRSCR